MKNQYFGDVGDYGKYGLLCYLAENGKRIAVNWYLTNDDDSGSKDGKHTNYLEEEKEKEYRRFAPNLYDLLRGMLFPKPGTRDVKKFEEKNFIQGAVYYHDLLKMRDYRTAVEKRAHRYEWHEKALEVCKDAELVFLDPDNGLTEKNPKGRKRPKPLRIAEKYAYAEEAAAYYERGQDVVYYCHKGRRKDKEWGEYKLLMKEYVPGAELMGITFHRGTQRSYIFVCHPERAGWYREVLATFVKTWDDLFTPEPIEGFKPIAEMG